LNGMSNNVVVGTIEKFECENMAVSAALLFIFVLNLETHLVEILPPLDNQRKYFILDIRRVN
jgi:hypothetical protein